MSDEPSSPREVRVRGGAGREAWTRLNRARTLIAFLVGVIVVLAIGQWLTAMALWVYIQRAEGGPTAKSLDSIFSLCCLGLNLLAALGGGWAGVRFLRSRDGLEDK